MVYESKHYTNVTYLDRGAGVMDQLIEKYTALVEEEPTEYWDAADWAYHYAYQEILKDLSALLAEGRYVELP